MWQICIQYKTYDWNFKSEPQPQRKNTSLYNPKTKQPIEFVRTSQNVLTMSKLALITIDRHVHSHTHTNTQTHTQGPDCRSRDKWTTPCWFWLHPQPSVSSLPWPWHCPACLSVSQCVCVCVSVTHMQECDSVLFWSQETLFSVQRLGFRIKVKFCLISSLFLSKSGDEHSQCLQILLKTVWS